jgi:16S rRNA (adenine1518-N6/adenine1519-N6)-dimethyltransferase
MPTDTVIEVGPGTGALTKRLVASGARVIAIEKDHRLIEPIRAAFADAPNLTIIEGDILELDVASLHIDAYKIVANIPYYLTSHLIRLMLERWPTPSLAILMVQEEVARRMMAAPPDMNLLALSVQLYATPAMIMRVSRGSFRPSPDVDSAVISITPTATEGERQHARAILELAKKAFGQKRKQLKATIAVEALARAGISPTARPQELTIDDWRRLAGALQ